MGCYNKTCGITQFPIVYGDKTVNFIIVEDGFGDRGDRNFYVSGHGWKLIPIPFYGRYDDYGWQEDHDGQQAKYDFLAEHFKDDIVEFKDGKIISKDVGNPFKNSDTLNQSIRRGNIRLKNPLYNFAGYGTKTRTISSFMINRIVWEALTDKFVDYHRKEQVYTRKEIADTIQQYLILHRNNKQEWLNKRNTLSGEELELFDLEHRMLDLTDTFISSFIEKKFSNKWFGNPHAGCVKFCAERPTGSSCPVDFLPFLPLDKDVITPEDVAATYLMLVSMSSLRKTIQPMSHEGSQSGVDHAHEALIKCMKKIFNNVKG